MSGNFITVSIVVSSINVGSNPPPYTNITLIVNGHGYTLPEADTYQDLVDWLNTTGTGVWGLNINTFLGTVTVNVIDITGQNVYTSLTLTDDDSDTVTFDFPRQTSFGSILLTTDLDGCINTEAVAPTVNNPTLVYVPPFTLNTVTTSNGLRQIQQTISNETELDILMSELGWTKNTTETYEIDNQPFIWEQFNLVVNGVPSIMYIDEFSCAWNNENTALQNFVTLQVDNCGDVLKESLIWGIETVPQQCNYNSIISSLIFPYTSVRYIMNGQTISLSNITSEAALISLFTGWGFQIIVKTNSQLQFRINQTTNTLD